MKKLYVIILTVVLLAGCEEFQPVFTGGYARPEKEKTYTDADFGKIRTIAEAKALYVPSKHSGSGYEVQNDFVIKGRVTTSDQVGNLYKTLYIQDETAGIEIKIGKNGLYNEYKVGQWVYVQLEGLTVGNYKGMINIGYKKDDGSKYETSYLEHYNIIDTHIFKGEYSEAVQPQVITEAQVKDSKNLGRLVTIKDLTYSDMVFVLAYIDANGDHEDYTGNCIFIDEDWKNNKRVNTWAMSESLWKEYLYSGIFDGVEAAGSTVGAFKDENGVYKISNSAYSVSQYFKMGSTTIQVRSSGYARFSDTKIPEEVLNGAKVSFTGILTIYNGEYQMTLIDLDGVRKSDGTPWYVQ